MTHSSLNMKFLLSELKNLTPTKPTIRLSELYTPRNTIDVGTGTGKNAIYLAKKGFDVTATDKSSESIYELQKFAEKENLPLKTLITDLKTDTPIFSDYNIVIFSFVLHYLRHHRSFALLQEAIGIAKVGDIHLISAMTTEGDFKSKNPDSYYPKPNELREYYTSQNWNIIEYCETESPARVLRPDGTPMSNLVAHLIAEKK